MKTLDVWDVVGMLGFVLVTAGLGGLWGWAHAALAAGAVLLALYVFRELRLARSR